MLATRLAKATTDPPRKSYLSQYSPSAFIPNPHPHPHHIYQRAGICSPSFACSNMFATKEQPSHNSKVLVFGAGNFGSCLASHLGDSRHDVYMWARDESIVKHFNVHHRNLMYLRDHQFPANITAIGPDLPSKEFMDGMDVLLFAIPTQFLRYLRYRSEHWSCKILLC